MFRENSQLGFSQPDRVVCEFTEDIEASPAKPVQLIVKYDMAAERAKYVKGKLKRQRLPATPTPNKDDVIILKATKPTKTKKRPKSRPWGARMR